MTSMVASRHPSAGLELASKVNEIRTRDEANQHCADCGAFPTSWASVNLGLFLCIRCAGIHRSLGVHISQVRSCTLDSWSLQHCENMARVGNAQGRVYYESCLRFFSASTPTHPNQTTPTSSSSLSLSPPSTPVDDYPLRPSPDSPTTVLERWIRAKYEGRLFVRETYADGRTTRLQALTSDLPEHLWVAVFLHCDWRTLLSLRAVCKRFLVFADASWAPLFSRVYPSLRLSLSMLSPKTPASHRAFFCRVSRLLSAVSACPSSELPVLIHLSAPDPSAATSFLASLPPLLLPATASSPSSPGSLSLLTTDQDNRGVPLLIIRLPGGPLPPKALLSPSRSSPSHPASSSSPSPLDSSANQSLFPLTILITPDAPSSDDLQPSDGPASFSQGPDLARQLFCYLVAQFGMLGFPGVTAPPIWVPDSFSPVCLVCLTKFTFSRRRHHCRRCGTLICRACSSFKDFPAERKLPSSSSSSPSFLKVRLCINCTQLDPSLVRLSLLNPDPVAAAN